jgi:NADH:ubiquinone oxidoreductase subunit E
MSGDLKARVSAICSEHDSDAGRMIDIARFVQAEFGCVSEESAGVIADWTGATLADVESCVSFYSFLSRERPPRMGLSHSKQPLVSVCPIRRPALLSTTSRSPTCRVTRPAR